MTKTGKSKRQVAFDAKRAARFDAAGVRIDTIDPRGVRIGYAGIDDSETAECSLCDHSIKYLFILDLKLTNGHVERFDPVGSSCIRTWADSLPHSAVQQALLDAIKLAEEQVERVKASFRAFNGQVRSGKLTQEDADALVRYLSSPPAVRDNSFLSDVAAKVEKFGGWYSDNQRGAWLRAFQEQLNRHRKPGTPPVTFLKLQGEDADLVARARKLLDTNKTLATTLGPDIVAFKDIIQKVEAAGRFASDRQRGFFASMVKRGEGTGRAPTPPKGTPVPTQRNFFEGADERFGPQAPRAFPACVDGQRHPNEDRNNASQDYDDLPM